MTQEQLSNLYSMDVNLSIYICFKNNVFSFSSECEASDLEEDYEDEFVYCRKSSLEDLKSKGFVEIESYDDGDYLLGKKRFDAKENDAYYVNITDLSEQEIESIWKVYESCEDESDVKDLFTDELADAICELKGKKRVDLIKRYPCNLTCFYQKSSEHIDFDNQQGCYTKREWKEELQEKGFCHISIEKILDELEYCGGSFFAADAGNGNTYTFEDVEEFLTDYRNGKADRDFLPNDKSIDDVISSFMRDMKDIDDKDDLSDGEREGMKENQTYCATVDMIDALKKVFADFN